MAIYHLSVKIIGRNDGRSSVAAAAYRSAECITNEYDGVEHDFTNKNWVEHTEIMLPDNAPEEYNDRSTLWNSVEMIEKSQDAQLAREFEIALPVELTREQQIQVVNRFVRDNLTRQGMIADIAIHNPPKTNDRHQPIDESGKVTRDKEKMQFINPHAHILCTVRPLDEKGRWTKKSEIEYLCKKGNEERAFTASEYKEAKEDGWQKQYKYKEGNKKTYYTAAEAEERGLERVNRTPKTTPYGRKNEIVEYWNDKDRIFEWRQQWERAVNDEFAHIQSDIRIDSRSFKDQGRENEQPTIHMGPAAINMEKRAEREIREGKSEAEVNRSDIGNINRQVKEHNKFVRELKIRFDKIAASAKDVAEEIAKRLEGILARLIGNHYEETIWTKKYNRIESELVPEAEILEEYKIEVKKVKDANKQSANEIKRLKKELKSCSPLQIKRKAEIQKAIRNEQDNIEYRSEYMQSVGQKYQFTTDEDYDIAARKHTQKVDHYNKLGNTITAIREESEKIIEEYHEVVGQISDESEQSVQDKRIDIRSKAEAAVKNELLKKQGDTFDMSIFDSSKKDVDRMLYQSDTIKGKTVKKTRHH